jgi:putative endonuclease
MKGWFVYILRCRDGSLYTGIAVDVQRRLDAHQRGAGAKYTRSRRPLALVYHERQPDRSRALRRETAIRRLGRAGKLALIAR